MSIFLNDPKFSKLCQAILLKVLLNTESSIFKNLNSSLMEFFSTKKYLYAATPMTLSTVVLFHNSYFEICLDLFGKKLDAIILDDKFEKQRLCYKFLLAIKSNGNIE